MTTKKTENFKINPHDFSMDQYGDGNYLGTKKQNLKNL